MPTPSLSLSKLLQGDPAAVARAISVVENREEGAQALLGAVALRAGKAHRIGVAGPPGAGKSTLIARLIGMLRKRGRKVGIVATDPTSPVSGGAILGDRLRIREDAAGPDVFYRSMATRGHRGGLARACRDTIRVLEASGKDAILVETVGVGQSEIDIASIVDTLIVVLVPESGDFIQAVKAGILEVGDILVVNKADRPGSADIARELEGMLEGKRPPDGWIPPVLQAVAKEGRGIEAVADAAQRHREHLGTSKTIDARRRRQALAEIRERLSERFLEEVEPMLSDATLGDRVEAILAGKETPDSVVRELWYARGKKTGTRRHRT